MSAPNIVWFKRDLRVRDHEPLQRAAAMGSVLPLYVIEVELWRQKDMSARHWQWLRARLQTLDQELRERGAALTILRGDIIEIFHKLHAELGIKAVYGHEEIGNSWTYARDRRVAAWLRQRGIPWEQSSQDGVQRGLKDRDRWQAQRDRFMRLQIAEAPATLCGIQPPLGSIPTTQLPSAEDLDLDEPLLEQHIPVATPAAAHAQLQQFIREKQQHYLAGMSSPRTAFRTCSRLSPYLALGIYSTRQSVQELAAAQRLRSSRGLSALQARLAWRGHFMQKFEDEPRIEHENLQRALDGLRESEFDRTRFDAWSCGETGFPLVDACMRSLQATGWLNFRMRAMLVSFSSYALWLHWREPALHLARLFLDYEPGIHYPQVQMQAGTTGINALRIYNVTKQAQELDPEGTFLRQWLPELAALPAPWIQQPWLLPRETARRYNVELDRDYPSPIVSLAVATRQARTRIYAARRAAAAREEAEQILQRHGSRKRNRLPRSKPEETKQLSLF